MFRFSLRCFLLFVILFLHSKIPSTSTVGFPLSAAFSFSFPFSSRIRGPSLYHGSITATARSTTTTVTSLQSQKGSKPRRTASRDHPSDRETAATSFPDSRKLNNQIVQCETASEIFQVLQKSKGLTKKAGGNILNQVNFSTSLHRLARHSVNNNNSSSNNSQQQKSQQPQERSFILRDPRFALLVAGLAEAFLEMEFSTREVSNVGWALAKLKIVPPQSAQARQYPSENHDSGSLTTLESVASLVRQQVLDAAQQQKQNGEPLQPTWIPTVSKLAGMILDLIGDQFVNKKTNSKRKVKKEDVRLQEYANLLWAWATADRADAAVFAHMIRSMMERKFDSIDELRPQEWSNSIWAFATAQIYSGHTELMEYVADLMEKYPSFLSKYKPQELSNTIWGIATLMANKPSDITEREEQAVLRIMRQVAGAIRDRAFDFKSQELSNSAWAFATVGFGLGTKLEQSPNNYIFLTSDMPREDRELMKEALEAIVAASLRKIRRFRSQELNNLAWSLARLVDNKNKQIDELLHEIGNQFCDKRRIATSQDIAMTLWSLATLEFFDDEIYRGVASRIDSGDGASFKPQELSNTLWALATSEMDINERDAFESSLIPPEKRPKARDPVTRCFGIAARELSRRPDQFKSQEIKDVLWSFSKIGIRHPQLFKQVTSHLIGCDSHQARGLDEFSPQGLGNMAWAFARQAQLAEEASDRFRGSTFLSNISGRLSVYTASYVDIGEASIQTLFARIAESAIENHGRLSALKPQDLSNTAWTFAVLGMRHEDFLSAAKEELARRAAQMTKGDKNSMTIFKGQELANLLWALATLNAEAESLLDDLSPYIATLCTDSHGKITVESISKVFKRQELANIAWSCAVFGVFPDALMGIVYMGLLGNDGDSPARVSDIHKDDGLQQQAIMTLLYVQATLDKEKDGSKLRLPENFPESWRQAPGSSPVDHMTETGLELNLSTSKIQRAVSAAFDRIGFVHEEEHVITMREMLEQYGVRVPPKDVEVLSIDIADVGRRIAIEVDGPAHFITIIGNDEAKEGFSKISNGKLEYQFGWDGSEQVLNGATALKQRLLQSFGWKTVSIPFWTWSNLGGDPQKEESFCRATISSS